jgi:hypothetical protein
MTWSLCDHHPGGARMTCGRSPHHDFTITCGQRFAFGKDLPSAKICLRQRFAFGKALLRAEPESKPASSGQSPDDIRAKLRSWLRHDVRALPASSERSSDHGFAMTCGQSPHHPGEARIMASP